jgi:hypothetical protein
LIKFIARKFLIFFSAAIMLSNYGKIYQEKMEETACEYQHRNHFGATQKLLERGKVERTGTIEVGAPLA